MVNEPRRPDAVGLTVRYEEARDAGPIGRELGPGAGSPGGGLVRYAPEFAALGS